jgi:RNA polymerase sigma factor (sigma-70 family)
MPPRSDEYTREILRLERFLRAYLHRFTPQPADIEDLLQETYSHLFKLTPEQRAAIGNVQGFAVRSARNVALDWIRRRRVVTMESLEELADQPFGDDAERLVEIAHSHQQLVRVAREVAGLPDRCRRIFTLRRVYGLSQKEIAQRLGIAEGTVEQQLVKAMRHCVERLRETPSGVDARERPARSSWLERLGRGARKPGGAR